jgi:hypothetical protein
VEVAELGREAGFDHTFHQLVVTAPVGDQVADSDHLQVVTARVVDQVRHPRHRAVVVQDLADHRRRVEPGEPCQVHSRLGMAGPLEDSAGLGLEREQVTRLAQVTGAAARVDRRLDRAGPVVGRDPGGHALAGLDRDRERGGERGLVLGRHQVEPELVASLGRQRQADQAPPLFGHEVDSLGCGELRRQHQVTLVLPVRCVADHDHPAGAEVLERVVDRRERSSALVAHRLASVSDSGSRAPGSSFSTYFATTSTSTLTASPGASSRSVVRSSVSGISATAKRSSSAEIAVSETPSSATDPFSTT